MTARHDPLALLEAAAFEGAEVNLRRFLAFLGWVEREVVELQVLDVPRRKASWSQGRQVEPARDFGSYVAHAESLDAMLALIEEAEGWRGDDGERVAGVYFLLNRPAPEVASRSAEPGRWRRMRDGTSDGEILVRRALYIDLDADRPKGISARQEHVARTFERAVDLAKILTRLIPAESLGWGHSGNGAALFVALDALPCGAETDRLVRAALVAIKHLASDVAEFNKDRPRDESRRLVAIDPSVSDRKRLCPAFGSWKRKGGQLADRPHRRTAFLAPEQPHRLSLNGLRALVEGLKAELPAAEARDEVDRMLLDPRAAKAPRAAAPRAGEPRAASSADAPGAGEDGFALANRIPVLDVLGRLGLLEGDRPVCPGCRRSNRPGGMVEVVGNGIKCSSGTCSLLGHPSRPGFRSVVDLVMEAQALRPGEALAWLRGEFPGAGIPAPSRQAPPKAAHPAPQAGAAVPPPPPPVAPPPPAGGPGDRDWESLLSVGKNGLANTLGNAVTILANDPAWRGALSYDVFAAMVRWMRPPPFAPDYAGQHGKPGVEYPQEVTDEDATRIVTWLERAWHLRISDTIASKALETAARNATTHPVREYLRGLTWDGKPRVDTWLQRHFGVPDTQYARWVGRWWLISAVARILHNVSKADHVLIFEGKQGFKKSTALRVLGDPWFCDELPKLDDKDARQQIRGIWICEVAELDALGRTEIAAAKKFFGQTVDRYRPSFGRRAQNFPRQCVFAGTVNEFEYLRDPTGNRRFWPVRPQHRADIAALSAERDQLWAEAVAAFEAGERWYPDTDEEHAACEAEQEQRYQADAWETRIAGWLRRERCARAIGDAVWEDWQPVHVGEVLAGALGLKAERWDRQAQTRAGQVLARLGWVRGQRIMVRGVRVVPWWGPGTPRDMTHGPEGQERLKDAWRQLDADQEDADGLPTCQGGQPHGWHQKPAENMAIANLPTCQPYARVCTRMCAGALCVCTHTRARGFSVS